MAQVLVGSVEGPGWLVRLDRLYLLGGAQDDLVVTLTVLQQYEGPSCRFLADMVIWYAPVRSWGSDPTET